MEFTPKRRRIIKQEILLENTSKFYCHDLQLYREPPKGQIALEEFQEIAVERQKVLQMVDTVASQCLASISECKTALHKALKKEGITHYEKLLYGTGCSSQSEDVIQARKRDHFSHFILRLAYGQKENSMMWFLKNENELFKWRFTSLNKEGIQRLMSIYDFNYKPISREERAENISSIRSSSKEVDIDNIDIYKVPFEDVLDLVHERKVFIKHGTVYLPQSDLMSVFVTFFRQTLSDQIMNVQHYLSNISHDDRILMFLKALPECFSGMTRVIWNEEKTPLSLIYELAKPSFPMCMRIQHEVLTTKHHLKNGSRLAYGMFLKGIGVSLEDSLQFWKNEFAQGKNRDKFEKEHSYTIRHFYGREGKRTSYTPYGCTKLINTVVGEGEYHGCPFRYMDNNSLKKKLTEYMIPEPYLSQIIEASKNGEYLQGCRKYFEAMHKRPPENIIFHPNRYFLESRAVHNEQKPSEVQNTHNQSQTQNIRSQSLSQNYVQESQKTFSPSTKPKVEKKDMKEIAPKKIFEKKEPINIEQLLNEDDDDFNDIDFN